VSLNTIYTKIWTDDGFYSLICCILEARHFVCHCWLILPLRALWQQNKAFQTNLSVMTWLIVILVASYWIQVAFIAYFCHRQHCHAIRGAPVQFFSFMLIGDSLRQFLGRYIRVFDKTTSTYAKWTEGARNWRKVDFFQKQISNTIHGTDGFESTTLPKQQQLMQCSSLALATC